MTNTIMISISSAVAFDEFAEMPRDNVIFLPAMPCEPYKLTEKILNQKLIKNANFLEGSPVRHYKTGKDVNVNFM